MLSPLFVILERKGISRQVAFVPLPLFLSPSRLLFDLSTPIPYNYSLCYFSQGIFCFYLHNIQRKTSIQAELEKQEKHNTFVDKREKEVLDTKGLSSHELVKMKFEKLLGRAPKERGVPKKKNLYNLAVILCLPIAFNSFLFSFSSLFSTLSLLLSIFL